MHLDIDAFFASVEQLLIPRLRGRPVIVGSGCIASCSYEARRSGLHAGMSLGQARSLCPRAVVLKGDYQIYRCFAQAVWALCRQYADTLETFLDEAYADMSDYCHWAAVSSGSTGVPPVPSGGTGFQPVPGNRLQTCSTKSGTGISPLAEWPKIHRRDACATKHIMGRSPLEIGQEIQRRIREEIGLPASIGLACNRMLAKIASGAAKPSGVVWIQPGTEGDYLAPLPIEEIPGIGGKTAGRFHDMNIRTVSDLRALPRQSLEAMLGVRGLAIYERCRGRDDQPVRASGAGGTGIGPPVPPSSEAQRSLGVSDEESPGKNAEPVPSEDPSWPPQKTAAAMPPKDAALPPKTISRETTFHQPSSEREYIRGMLFYLLERALRTARQAGLLATTVALHIRYDDFQQRESAARLEEPTDADQAVFAAVLEMLDRLHTRRVALRHVGLTLGNFRPAGSRGKLFEPPAQARRDRLYKTLDQIRCRFGHAAVVSGESISLLGQLQRNDYGFVLRTPSLTK
jgi:nucleotidyltransferase/DNA polymerase involved in DNA repair